MQDARSRAGFTMYELMVVLAIMAFIASLAIPSLNRYRLQEATRTDATILAGALRTARERAIREGGQYFVLFNAGTSAPGAIARVIQDIDSDFVETGGVDIAGDVFPDASSPPEVTAYGLNATPFPGGVRTPNDSTGGALGTVPQGSGFPFDPVSGDTAVGFTSRGIPVALPTPTAWGSGTGAYYFTDNDQIVYAVDVGPLGDVRVRLYSPAVDAWN